MLNKLNNIILNAQSVATVNYFKELINDGPSKFITCLLTGAAGWISTFFAPIWSVIVVVCVFIFLDAVLGTKVSMQYGNKFESRRLWSTLKKFGNCAMIISCCHLMDTEIIKSIDMHLVEIFSGIVCGVELWSMIENLQAIDPNGPWRIFSKFIRSKGEKYLDITIEKKDLPKIKKMVKKIK